MFGQMSPLMLIAGKGLMQNTALTINIPLQSKVNTYKNFYCVKRYADILGIATAKLTYTNPTPPPPTEQWPCLSTLYTFANNTCPALVNSTKSTASWYDSSIRYTTSLYSHANNILGNGDLSKFVYHMNSVMANGAQYASFIDAAEKTYEYMGPTYVGMDSLTTGGITSVSKATVEFGQDLVNTGLLIDLNRLKFYGTPHMLIMKLTDRGLIHYISEELRAFNINPNTLANDVSSYTETQEIPLDVQFACYEAFKTVTGTKLKTIMQSLRINLPNGPGPLSIRNLTDLLDTRRLFPTSFRTLTAPTANGFVLIYRDNTGGVNSAFTNLGQRYHSIMPPGQVDANRAFSRAMQQLKNVEMVTVADLGNAAQKIQTNYGLGQVNSLDNPIPDSVYSYYTNGFANGSGPSGRFYLSDGIGTPAGITHNDSFEEINDTMQFLTNRGALNNLNDIFDQLYDEIDAVVDDSGMTDPCTGSIDGLISDAAAAISAIQSSYPTQYNKLNSQWTASHNQIAFELGVLAASGVNFATTPSNPETVRSLTLQLHNYAKINEYRGPAEMIEKMANTNILEGQAVVGTIREGRNLKLFDDIGLRTDNLPEPDDSSGTADVDAGIYSADEAVSNSRNS